MADKISPENRSKLMAKVKAKDTAPEMIVRKRVHSMGFRYRLHEKCLPGKPDLVFKSRKAVIFVHGCFWHGHECDRFSWPKTRREWWETKLRGNRDRDLATVAKLSEQGFRSLIVWECGLRGPGRLSEDRFNKFVRDWLESGRSNSELMGKEIGNG